jgi:5,10-methylenetetrahydromethanopterin reductase
VRFGAAFFPSMPVGDVTEIGRLAESLGYEDLWILDQSFHHDPFLLLAKCAEATSSLRLGVAVTNPVSRHPVQIARVAATLDQITEGRFVLGLGGGNRTRVLPALGLPMDQPATRIEEAIDVCRKLFAGEQVSLQGRTLSLTDVRLEMDEPGKIPIYVGSRGPRVLRLAGAKADGVFAEAMFTPEGMNYAIAEVERGARDANRDPAEVEVVAWQAIRLSTTMAAGDDYRYRSWAALLMQSMRDDVLATIGVPPDAIQSVAQARASGRQTALSAVPDDVVARLVLGGDPDGIERQLRAVEARGIDTVSILGFGNTEIVKDTLRRFASDVMARFDH